MFPVLLEPKTKYSVLWQDDDNEWITIQSDEELVTALTEMVGPVYKLHAQFITDETDAGSDSDLTSDCTPEGE